MNDKETLYKNINSGIIEERYTAFQRNLEKNLLFIKKFGGLKGIIPFFKGKHVIIAGAGPSLAGNMELLAGVQGRADVEIISADMALKPLFLNGIKPGYVISCETTPVDFFGSVETGSMHLIAFSCMSNLNLRRWKGGISFFNWILDDSRFNRLWENAGTGLGYLATGSIVTTQAVSFALGCGVRSIALVGNDLGFISHYHAIGAVSHMKNIFLTNRFFAFSSMEMSYARQKREYEIRRGEKLYYTSSQFLAAKMWLEDMFSRQNIPVYDCSEPGCSGKFVIKINLGGYLDSIKKKKRRDNRR